MQKRLTLANSATRSADQVFEPGVDLTPFRGAILVVDVTGTSGDGTQDLQVDVQFDDPASSNTPVILSDTFSDGATGTRVYAIYPGIADGQASYDAIEETPLPHNWEVNAQVLQGGGSGDFTYSIGAILLQ